MEKDARIRDLAQTVLTLRDDLVFTPQTLDGKPGYMVEDPLRTKFYRIGIPEYTFISLLDGNTSVGDALRLTASTLSEQAFTEQDAATLCKWLVDVQLANTEESAQANRLNDTAETDSRQRWSQRMNPIFIRLPLFRPDPLLHAIRPWTIWLFRAPTCVAVVVLLVMAAYQVCWQWDRFMAASQGVFEPSRWAWLGLCWLALKLVHEASHGLVCKKYGGSVREAGVLLILFAPIAFVDVTASWRFRSRWQRIQTAAAGMYIEVAIASIAALVWSSTEAGLLNDICFNLIAMAGFTTLLFNANPLMRFDGYYILSDLLDIPNLYANGQQYTRHLGRKYLLGAKSTLPRWTLGKGLIIRAYGVGAFVWRIVVTVTLLILAATLFAGAGVLLTVLGTIAWIGPPVWRFLKYLVSGERFDRPDWLKLFRTAAIATGVVIAFTSIIPWPGSSRAPAIVEYAPLSVVRSGSPGMIREVAVHGGEEVEAGQKLVVVENRELQLELADLELAIEQSRVKGRQHQQSSELAEYQAEVKTQESLEKKQAEMRSQIGELTVLATAPGKVIGRQLDALVGTYVQQGDELFSIGNEDRKEVRISIGQDDVETFAERTGQTVTVRLPGASPFECRLDEVDPRASLVPSHRSLCASEGGSLPVRQKENRAESESVSVDDFEFLAPRFSATVALDTHQSRRFHAGQLGVSVIRERDETFGEHLYYLTSRWFREQWAASGN